jgi:hypothetical protein
LLAQASVWLYSMKNKEKKLKIPKKFKKPKKIEFVLIFQFGSAK